MVNKRPSDLSQAITPLRSGDVFVVDQNADGVNKVDVANVVDSVAPVATTSEAQVGTNDKSRMTPLKTKQSISSEIGISIASSAQGSRADTAVQPNRSISSGTGLSGGGTLASDITLSLSSTSLAAIALANSSVQPSRQIIAGYGLTGGGNLSSDVTLSLSSDTIVSLNKSDTALQAPGGATGQVLTKSSGTDNDVSWQTVAAATAVSYAPQTLTSPQQAQARSNISAQQAGAILEALRLASGPAADQLPYMTSSTAAAFTALSSFARTVLDDTTGNAMWATITGRAASASNPGYIPLPNGLLLQFGNQSLTATSGVCTVTYPTAFTTFAIPVFVNGDTNSYGYTPQGFRSGATGQFTTYFPGGTSAGVRICWIAIGV